ncbi:hypothetical protein THAOC_10031, partial [Thalassiosira oceanica]
MITPKLQLPVRLNGGGFRSCDSQKDAQYAGRLAQSELQLLDQKDDRGNVVPGRMHTPSLVNHFGETSFNHARDRDWHPWRHLLDNSNGNIATGLQQASSQMKTNFEDVAIDGIYDQDSCLVLQDVTRFGFNCDGTRPISVTHELTVQLETMEFHWLLQKVCALPTSRFDRWAFGCCDVFSQQVMLAAPPNAMGHMGNEASVNEYTTNLCCCAHLPGGGFRVLNDQVKTLIITFLRLAGVEADEELALWMLGMVQNPYMQRYTDAILQAQAQNKKNPEGTIVADFVASDFPVTTQASNDSRLGGRTDVLGEVKTLQPSKTSYNKGHCQTNKPVNLRATQAVRSYGRRAAGLDQKYVQEFVGDGTNGQVGPFETALGEFYYTGNSSSHLLSEHLVEVNEDASKLITKLSAPHCQ